MAEVTAAQVLFGAALAMITLAITLFAVYVVSTTFWGDRWARRPRRVGGGR